MITALKCVTDVSVYIQSKLKKVKVFKYDDKPVNYVGEYIAVNNLPFVYGKLVNDVNVINVNIHAPKLPNRKDDRIRLEKMLCSILCLFPTECDGIEDNPVTTINGVTYLVKTTSQPMEDSDNTYFINVQLKVTFNDLHTS